MFYIVDKITRQLIRTSKERINIDESVNEFGDLIQLRHVEDANIPAFDKATHKLQRNVADDDVAYTRTFSYVAVPLTQAELDANAATNAEETTRTQIKTAITAMRNGTGTASERLARIERAMVFILREFVR